MNLNIKLNMNVNMNINMKNMNKTAWQKKIVTAIEFCHHF
jgi:hypothetical protein